MQEGPLLLPLPTYYNNYALSMTASSPKFGVLDPIQVFAVSCVHAKTETWIPRKYLYGTQIG